MPHPGPARHPFRFPPAGDPLPTELNFYVGRGHLDPEWPAYGAVPDFDSDTQTGTDNCTAFQACINDAIAERRPVRFSNTVPGDQFLINCALRGTSALVMIGNGSVNDGTHLVFGNTTGSCLQLTGLSNRIESMVFDATDARLASGDPTTRHGLLIADDDEASPSGHSNTTINDVSVKRQPGAGIYMIGGVLNSTIRGGIIGGNYGPGILADDGTFHGYTHKTGDGNMGAVALENIRIYDNGGEAIRLGTVGHTYKPFRFDIIRAEVNGNGWNAAARDYDAQLALVEAQNCRTSMCAWGDSTWNSTTTLFGDPRDVKADRGLAVRLVTAHRIILENDRFIECDQSVNASSCLGIRVSGPTIAGAIDQPLAFDFDNLCLDVHLDIPGTSGATQVVAAMGPNNSWRYAGEHYRGVGASTGGQRLNNPFVPREIDTGSLNTVEQNVRVLGQDDLTDSMANIYVQGITPPDGTNGIIFSSNAYDITIQHGLGNIRTRTGANITLNTNQAYHWYSDGTNIYVF